MKIPGITELNTKLGEFIELFKEFYDLMVSLNENIKELNQKVDNGDLKG